MKTHLQVGGLVAAGFDQSGEYLLVISHGGRGVFSTKSWERVARDYELAYPENGVGVGIGPIEDQPVQVTEIDYDTLEMCIVSEDGQITLECESHTITVDTKSS